MTLSVATIISGANDLKYPLVAVLESVAPIADEIVINVDTSPERDDGTIGTVNAIRQMLPSGIWVRYGRSVRIETIQSRWNWSNHDAGTEFARQSNIAVAACTGDWILYIQADEVIHEQDHVGLRWVMNALSPKYAGVQFTRLCFWRDLQTLRRDWTVNMTRMFRRGRGWVVSDSMFCEVDGGDVFPVEEGTIPEPSIWHYSRIGNPEIIAARIQANDVMHHPTEEVETGGAYDFKLRSYDSYARGTVKEDRPESVLERFEGRHPEPILRWFAARGIDTGQALGVK